MCSIWLLQSILLFICSIILTYSKGGDLQVYRYRAEVTGQAVRAFHRRSELELEARNQPNGRNNLYLFIERLNILHIIDAYA